MTKLATALFLAAACTGTTVCAGCGGDGVDDLPDAFHITYVYDHSVPNVDCGQRDLVGANLTGMTGSMPMLADNPCSAPQVVDGAWTFTCTFDPPPENWHVTLKGDLSGGTLVREIVNDNCSDYFTITAVN